MHPELRPGHSPKLVNANPTGHESVALCWKCLASLLDEGAGNKVTKSAIGVNPWFLANEPKTLSIGY